MLKTEGSVLLVGEMTLTVTVDCLTASAFNFSPSLARACMPLKTTTPASTPAAANAIQRKPRDTVGTDCLDMTDSRGKRSGCAGAFASVHQTEQKWRQLSHFYP